MTIKKSGNSRSGYPYAQNTGSDIYQANEQDISRQDYGKENNGEITVRFDDGYLLALTRAGAWKEYTRRNNGNSLSTFAVQVCPNKRKALSLPIRNDAEYSRFMMRMGYVQIRTRKITRRWETFWLYRATGKELALDKGCEQVGTSNGKACGVVVQLSHKPIKAFKPVALDDQNIYVYDDHVRFLTKKRHRVNGVRVQGYTAKGLTVEVVA